MPDVALEPLRGSPARSSARSWSRSRGGADSAFLAWVAHDTLGAERRAGRHRGVAVAARRASGSSAPTLAAEWGLRWQEVETDELDNVAYARNDGDRCYWCKDALMAAAGPDRRRHAARRSCSA